LAFVTIIWWLVASSSTPADASGKISAGMQVQYILQHPGVIPKMISSTQYIPFVEGFIGSLGWMDTAMPHSYYLLMELMLLIAIAGEMVYRSRFRYSMTALIFLAAISSVAGVFLLST
jgi:hypothetical protein